MQDTFFLDEGLVLRTHTSPVQIRTMLSQEPPVYVVCPGRTYRRDSDPTHTPMFNQIEGLAVDEGLTLGHLKGTLAAMARHVFGEDVKVRLRPSYFQFVEPGVELDVSCFVCGGSDPNCKVCRGAGWLEMLGAGMVDPAVLEEVGYDPERTPASPSGWAPTGWRWSSTASRTCASSSRATSAFCASSRSRKEIPLRVPLHWLREYVDFDLSADELSTSSPCVARRWTA
jgi:phenylalanyl-tRNA synthetase alpha chain